MCEICEGRPDCPVCTPEKVCREVLCDACGGEGWLYFDGNDNLTPKKEWDLIPGDDTKDCDVCEKCRGEGSVWKELEE